MSAAITRTPSFEPPPVSSTTSAAPSRRRWPEGSRGALVHALVLTVLLPVAGMAIFMLVRPYLPVPDSHPFDGSAGAFARQLVRMVVSIPLFVGVALMLVGRLSLRDLGWRDLSLRQVAIGVAGFLATFVAFTAFVSVATDYTVGGFLEAVAGLSWRERLLGVLIGINASIVEESLFRGYLQPSLCKRLGTTGGVITTAVLFSLMHIPTNLVSFGGRLTIGLGLGFVKGKDRPLWAPAIAHTLSWIVIGGL